MMKIHNRKAFSMVELLLGIGIFGLAILPLIWVSQSQTRGAYSVGKHMMAGQLASSFLDQKLKMSYSECLEDMKNWGNSKSVIDDEELQLLKMVENLDSESAENDFRTSFRNFSYIFYGEKDEAKKIIRIDVEVHYRVSENDPRTDQFVRLSALKHGDLNG